MAQRGRPKQSSEANVALEAYARRLARAELAARIVCVALGAALAVGAVALFVFVIRLGPRATLGAVVGAGVLLVPAWLLLRRGLTGRDADRQDVDEALSYNSRLWWR
jgi:hypothetical protein